MSKFFFYGSYNKILNYTRYTFCTNVIKRFQRNYYCLTYRHFVKKQHFVCQKNLLELEEYIYIYIYAWMLYFT